MPDIGKAYVQIIPTTKDIAANVTKELAPVGDVGTSVGNNFGKKMLAAVAGLGIGAALGKIFNEALDAGGAMQQSFGGLDTLYGDASQAAKDYAMAAASAGISANDYAEQAVSFGASLKAAFGGDTLKAAEAANTAILDMADNSAKMGTDISTIQSAYQGLAKQNYTMLDNLKLGYGGTKTEMERLLADAEKLSGVKYDINNLGDVYQAIHVIQEDLGLTGVAAQEAATTLTGSAGAMKAAFENVLAGMANGMDISGSLTQLFESVSSFMSNNLLPMIQNIATAIPQALSAVAPQLGPVVTQLITTIISTIASNLPAILKAGIDIILSLIQGIINSIPDVLAAIPQVISGIVETFGNYDWMTIGKNLLSGIAEGIEKGVTGLVDSAIQACKSLTDSVKSFFGIKSPSKLMAQQVGQWIPAGIAEGIEKNLDVLDPAMHDLTAAVTGNTYVPGQQYSMADDLSRIITENENNVNVNVVLQGDANQIFKVVRKQNTKFKGSTGKSAFEY